ncbi:glycosyltransferase [Natrialbaceae archaeon A-CW2]
MCARDPSVVIPVYNDLKGIRRTLDTLLGYIQSKPEIIVVDNNSTDETPDIAAKYAVEHDHIHLEHETDIQSSYAARNTGIEHASSESDVICFLDADQRVTEGWLEAALSRLQSENAHYLAPNIELEAPENPTRTAQYNRISGFPIEDFLEHHHYAPTSCLFVTRELLEDVGHFDKRLVSGGDLEFGNRVYDAGYDLVFAPESTVIHPTRANFRSLWRRNVRIGRGHCQLQRYYPERYGRVGIPPRPSGIRNEQYDGSLHPLVYRSISFSMTGARGVGYTRECLSILADRARSR